MWRPLNAAFILSCHVFISSTQKGDTSALDHYLFEELFISSAIICWPLMERWLSVVEQASSANGFIDTKIFVLPKTAADSVIFLWMSPVLSINRGCLLVLPAFHQKASFPSSEALRTETDSKEKKEEVFNIQRLEKE